MVAQPISLTDPKIASLSVAKLLAVDRLLDIIRRIAAHRRTLWELSTSTSNRALVLGKGTCRPKNLPHSDGTQVTMVDLNDLKVRLQNKTDFLWLICIMF